MVTVLEAQGKAPEPCDLTVVEAGALIARRELTPVELVASCLDRIDSLEDDVQAWALVDRDGALATAQRLTDELQAGEPRGPLHGVPVGIKDIFYTAGLRTEANSPILAGFVPSYSATAVNRLEEAGAVILGKQHTAQFAALDPPPTRNPWNDRCTAGGSSSGSGAALAAGMCLGSLASQTGGSVGRPAAFTGTVGFKPTHGRISTFGMMPISRVFDHAGVLTRSVADAATMLGVLAGRDPRDPYSIEFDPRPGTLAPGPPRLAVAADGFVEHAESEMVRHFELVVESLSGAGASIVQLDLGELFAGARAAHRTMVCMDYAATHAERFAERPSDYAPLISGLIEEGLSQPAAAYAEAARRRDGYLQTASAAFDGVDGVLTPGAPGPAPAGLEFTGDPVMGVPWSFLGFPAITIPSGFSAGGLPLGLQIGASPAGDGEPRLLDAARWCESALDFGRQAQAVWAGTRAE